MDGRRFGGQKKSAVAFWDDYHSQQAPDKLSSASSGASTKEWIANPRSHLLELIATHMTTARRRQDDSSSMLHVRILEIGAGSSLLSRCLLSHLQQRRQSGTNAIGSCNNTYSIVATDVSEVCIEQSRTRDRTFISSLTGSDDELRYEVLDISASASMLSRKLYDIVLDKGCLDTLLFRNARGSKSTERHPPLIAALLTNVYNMLRPGGNYIVISPRKRIPSLNQFVGFSEIKQIDVDSSSIGELDGNQEDSTSKAFIYICNKSVVGGIIGAGAAPIFRDTRDLVGISDESQCQGCHKSFEQFRGGEALSGRGEVFWKRKWKGHQDHCSKQTGADD